MATDSNSDIVLDGDFDDKHLYGDFELGDGRVDDCRCILKLNSGALKSDPIMGPNLILMMNGKVTETDLKQIIDLHFRRDGKELKALYTKEEENWKFEI